jgi:hypothetical protein
MMKKIFTMVMVLTGMMLVLSSCEVFDQIHDEAEASLGSSEINYKGPSPHGSPEFDEEFNCEYLFLEDIAEGAIFGSVNDQPGQEVLAGPYQPDLRYLYAPGSESTNSRKGFISLGEGLELAAKGSKANFSGNTDVDRLFYLEVPLTAQYNYRIGQNSLLYAGLGPYAAAGLFGYSKSTYQGQTMNTPIKFQSSQDFARMDYGAVFKAGFFFMRKWDLSLNYDLGLRNLTPGSDDKAHNRTISLNLGYRFK